MAPTATSAAPTRGPTALQKPTKVRYYKGKPAGAERDDDSDSSEDDGEDDGQELLRRPGKPRRGPDVDVDEDVVAGGAGRVFRPAGQPVTTVGGKGAGRVKRSSVKMELGDVKVGGAEVKQEPDVEEESSEEESEEDEPARPSIPAIRPPGDESSEYETDSESEEEAPKPVFRPVFVRKDKRGMTQEKAAAEAEERIRQEDELREQRKNDSKEIAGETIRRELQEKEMSDLQPDVDDTDHLDPEAEFNAWRARELARLLREKQAQAAKDEEEAEIERRRAMPEDQRLAEDMAYAEETRNQDKTQMGFLQKYYHKGAFYAEEDILKRDYTGAVESQVDMSLLPKVMQVRDFGKASRTKYTHLADQDTSQGGWGNAHRMPAGYMGGGASESGIGQIGTTQTGCWNCGGPHLRKDCPNANINDPTTQQGQGGAYGSGNGNANGAGAGADFGSNFGWSGAGGGSGGPNDTRPQDNGYAGRSSRTYDGGRAEDRARDGRSGGGGRDRRDREDHSSGASRGEKGDERARYREKGRDRESDGGRDRDGYGGKRERSRSPRRGQERYDDRSTRRDRDRERDGPRERDREREREKTRDGDRHRDGRDRDRHREQGRARERSRERGDGRREDRRRDGDRDRR